MKDSNTPIVLVVCNDYGELAFALYLLAHQSFAESTTLLLPPRLYAKNPEALPGRTLVYRSLEDVLKEMDTLGQGILGLFSGYLLPIHNLCDVNELDSLLTSARAQGWHCFTSDPFLGLLDEVDPGELVKINVPRFSSFLSFFGVFGKKRLAAEAQVAQSKLVLSAVNRMLKGVLHLYPCGESPQATERGFGARLHFHNPDIFVQTKPGPSPGTPTNNNELRRWLFVLGDEDCELQRAKYGRFSHKFRRLLIRKLHETLTAGRMPTLIAPANVIEEVRKYSRAAGAMELVPHCEYSQFLTLLRDAEYVFYWNAVSFSCILRTLTDKPWFTFDDGHLLRGMNTDYAKRISEWFYRGDDPPRLDINAPLTHQALRQATEQYLKPAWRIRQGLLTSSNPQSLFNALEPGISVQDAFEIVQRLCEVVSANALDGNFVVDTALLTYPKRDLESAVKLLLEQGIGDQAEIARLAAPTLAFFQPGIGADKQAIDSPGPNNKPWRVSVEAEMTAISQILRI